MQKFFSISLFQDDLKSDSLNEYISDVGILQKNAFPKKKNITKNFAIPHSQDSEKKF